MPFVFSTGLIAKRRQAWSPEIWWEIESWWLGLFCGTWTVLTRTICVFWSQFQIWKLHLSLVSCNFITTFGVFVGTMFSTTYPWAPFSQKKHKGPPSLPETALGCGRCANWKGQLNASDLATLPSPISNKDQGLVSMWLWRRDIYLNIYASWKAFFNMYAQNITPETKKTPAPI